MPYRVICHFYLLFGAAILRGPPSISGPPLMVEKSFLRQARSLSRRPNFANVTTLNNYCCPYTARVIRVMKIPPSPPTHTPTPPPPPPLLLYLFVLVFALNYGLQGIIIKKVSPRFLCRARFPSSPPHLPLTSVHFRFLVSVAIFY